MLDKLLIWGKINWVLIEKLNIKETFNIVVEKIFNLEIVKELLIGLNCVEIFNFVNDKRNNFAHCKGNI